MFAAYIGEAFYLRTQTEAYSKQLWYFLQTWAEGMTIDAGGMFYWFPDGRYADRIGRRFEVVFYITDEPPGSGSNRQKYRRFYIDLFEREDTPPAPAATPTPTSPAPPPAGGPTPTPTPPSGGDDPCTTASSPRESSNVFARALGSLGLVKTAHAQQQCTEPTSSIDALYTCIGGSSSWLGLPTSGPYSTNDGPRQDFEGGYIRWYNNAYRLMQKDLLFMFLPPERPRCVQGLSGDQLSVANTYNRIGGALQYFSDQKGMEVEVALAVWNAESQVAGSFGGPNGELTIRFENHIFYDMMVALDPEKELYRFFNDSAEGGRVDQWVCFREGGCDQPPPSNKAGPEWIEMWTSRGWDAANPEHYWTGMTVASSQRERHRTLEFAKTFHEEAAYRSISMGGPQIMGREHTLLPSFSSATDMFQKFSANEIYQVIGFFEFLENKSHPNTGVKAIEYAKNPNFYYLAGAYNGTGNAPSYSQKMCTGYNAARQLFGKPTVSC